MPYTKQTLQTLNNLSVEDVNETLSAGQLPTDRSEYSDDEIHNCFDVIRNYFNTEQAHDYETAAKLFEQQMSATQPTETEPQVNGKKPITKPLDFSKLLSLSSGQVGTRVLPTEAIKIMAACGLSADAEQYNPEECLRFLETCLLLKKQSKSYEEVAEHFGKNTGEQQSDPVQQVDRVLNAMESTASELTDGLLQERAEAQALTDAQRYMLYYAKAVEEGEQVQEFWAQLKTHAKARLGGKSQARLLRAQPQTTLILPSSPNSMNSSENSENGMNAE